VNEISTQGAVKNFYKTPILYVNLYDTLSLNEQLQSLLLEKERSDLTEHKTHSKSNVGGWRSSADLFEWPSPAIGTLRQRLFEALDMMFSEMGSGVPKPKKYNLCGWANLNRDGSYNNMHKHPGSDLSCVYYVSLGTKTGDHLYNGAIQFQDPRPGAFFGAIPGFDFGKMITIEPKPGGLIVFPSWLEHSVHPFRGEGVRISIAINVSLEYEDSVGE